MAINFDLVNCLLCCKQWIKAAEAQKSTQFLQWMVIGQLGSWQGAAVQPVVGESSSFSGIAPNT